MITIIMIMITFNYKTFKDAQRCLAKPTYLVHSRWLTDLLFVSLYVDINWLNIKISLRSTERVVDVDGFFGASGLVLCVISRCQVRVSRFWQRCCSSLHSLDPNAIPPAMLWSAESEHMPDRTPERLPDKMSEHMVRHNARKNVRKNGRKDAR